MMLRLELDDSTLDALADKLAARLGTGAPSSPWMGIHEAAAYIGCSVSRMRKLTMLNDVPSHKDGARVLYRRDELDAFIASGGASTGR